MNARYKITVYREGDEGELLDLVEDPGEIHNLWCDPARTALKSAMLHEMIQGLQKSEPMKMPRVAQA